MGLIAAVAAVAEARAAGPAEEAAMHTGMGPLPSLAHFQPRRVHAAQHGPCSILQQFACWKGVPLSRILSCLRDVGEAPSRVSSVLPSSPPSLLPLQAAASIFGKVLVLCQASGTVQQDMLHVGR